MQLGQPITYIRIFSIEWIFYPTLRFDYFCSVSNIQFLFSPQDFVEAYLPASHCHSAVRSKHHCLSSAVDWRVALLGIYPITIYGEDFQKSSPLLIHKGRLGSMRTVEPFRLLTKKDGGQDKPLIYEILPDSIVLRIEME